MKLRVKVISSNMLIITAILLVGGLTILKTVDNFNLYTIYQYLDSQSNFSQQYISEYLKNKKNQGEALIMDKAYLEDKLGKQVGCKVTISGADEKESTPLQKSALEGNKAYLVSTEGPDRIFYMSFPVISKNAFIGSVTFEYSLYQADSMRRSLLFTILILFVVALAVSFILSLVFSYRLIKPLEKLTAATREFSKGNFKEIGSINTKDEIEKLASSFNEMGQDIKAMIGQLKTEQEKQKKFLDNVTHEIRTPLTNILGYADLLNRVEDESARGKYTSYITREGNRLLNMVNSLLELSRLNRYELSVEKTQTDLKTLIETAMELMAERAKRSGFTVECSLQNVTALVDGEKIKQAIINLLDNSIKYSEGDRINIRLWKEELVYISVTDNGKGIPEDDLKHITEPFYRVDKSRSRKLGGSGLGLSICRDIVKAHGGELIISSRENHGTTVTISLQP
ncbi:MAG TPA: HAMP domain-containing histidine kinase [Clostridiaceae bacterium]|nr:HAMP domain-containing histidine kinase [Clostridiaceae bacterium]